MTRFASGMKNQPTAHPGVYSTLDFGLPSAGKFLLAWWVFWIASNVLSNVSTRLQGQANAPDTLVWAARVDIVADVVSVAAAALAVLVVRGIDRRQRERSRHVVYLPHMPPPPPIFTPQPGAQP